MQTKPVHTWEWPLMAALAVVAALLRWLDLCEQGLWLDEAFSVWMARQPVADLLRWIVAIDQHPPLYYLLLNGWLRVAGDGEAAVRSLSALFGTATIPAIYLLTRRLLGVAPAAAAALLLALSPFHVRFAQEARMYTLLTVNATLALGALAHLLTGDRRRRWWALFILFSAATLLSHNTAVLYLLVVNIAMGAAVLLAPQTRGLALPRLRDWLWAQAAILLLWAPWVPAFVRQARAVDAEFWIQPPTAEAIGDTLKTFVSFHAPAGAVWIWGAAVLALALGVVALARRPALLALLALLMATPFVAELFVSLRRPIFYDRTLIWTTVPLFVLAAAGLGRARAIAIPATVAVGVLLVGNVLSLQAYYEHFTKEQWREAAAFVADRAGENDLLLFNATWAQIPFAYYFDRAGKQAPMHGAPVDLFDAGILEPKMMEDDVPALVATVRDAGCVWLVYSHDWYTDPEKIVPRVLRRELMSRGIRRFVGLELHLYERRGGPSCGHLR
jgi:mannosyltransferase